MVEEQPQNLVGRRVRRYLGRWWTRAVVGLVIGLVLTTCDAMGLEHEPRQYVNYRFVKYTDATKTQEAGGGSTERLYNHSAGGVYEGDSGSTLTVDDGETLLFFFNGASGGSAGKDSTLIHYVGGSRHARVRPDLGYHPHLVGARRSPRRPSPGSGLKFRVHSIGPEYTEAFKWHVGSWRYDYAPESSSSSVHVYKKDFGEHGVMSLVVNGTGTGAVQLPRPTRATWAR